MDEQVAREDACVLEGPNRTLGYLEREQTPLVVARSHYPGMHATFLAAPGLTND
ncbi:MAG: hypothetical protein IT378_10850 [Sandaracinaceae bacterium]|nr:hypothetical protein [Sandaracinaceae bacterium]